jgi:hypothetical protein
MKKPRQTAARAKAVWRGERTGAAGGAGTPVLRYAALVDVSGTAVMA